MLPRQPNQSLIDGIACLQALASTSAPVGVSELARKLSLETTRVHRLLRTFGHLGLAQQTAGRKYSVGPGIHVLSALTMFSSGLIRRSVGPLEGLHRLGHTVAMGVLWQDHVSYLYHAQPGMPVGQALGRVGLFPASRSSIGMVLLSARQPKDIGDLYRGRPVDGHQSVTALLGSLRRVRRQGYAAVSVEDGLSLAVPVGNEPLAAIALAGRITDDKTAELVAVLRETAATIHNSRS